MRRGTTPTHTFTVPFEIPTDSKVKIVYAQRDNILIERTTETCSIKENTISVTLTDEETLKFDCRSYYINGEVKPYPIEIQVGIKTPAGDKIWSDIFTDTPERCLRKDGVI